MSEKLLILMLAAVAAGTTVASADTITVNWAGGANYTVIQEALDAASEGDIVLVMPGTYTGPDNTNLDFLGTDVILMSDAGAGSTTIDGGGTRSLFYFHSDETAACVIEGFTLTNGSGATGGLIYTYPASPTVRDCVLTDSRGWYGGAVYSADASSSPTYEDCTFSGNEADRLGGAVYCEYGSNASFTNCTFSDNSSMEGGGGAFVTACSPTFTGCSFEGNSATDYMSGGGIYINDGASPTLTDCFFTGNSASDYGGAFVLESCSPSFTACMFAGNSADYAGAGYIYSSGAAPSFCACRFYDNTASYEAGAIFVEEDATPGFADCTFAGNSADAAGGAIYSYYNTTPELTGCTFYANSATVGSGIWCDDSFPLTNCIIAFGIGGEAVYCDGDPPYPSCTDIYGNTGGNWVGPLAGLDLVDNNLNENPLFCDSGEGDFTLDAASPCAAANAPACGRIGAWDVDCDSPVEAESWGAIKTMYR